MHAYRKTGMIVALGLTMAMWVSAAPPHDALWTAHVDVGRLAASDAGAYIRDRLTASGNAARMDAFQAIFRFDPRSDLHTVTLFSTGPREEDAVAVVRGRLDGEHIATVLRGQRSYHSRETETGLVVHGWIERRGASLVGPRRFHGAFPAPDVFVFGQNEEAVVRALSGPGPAAPETAGDAFLTIVLNTARMPAGEAAQAAILQRAEHVTVAVSSEGHALRTRLALTATDEGIATNLKNVLDGMRSVLVLQAETNPDLAALAETATVTRDNLAISVDFLMPLDMAERLLYNALPTPGL